MRSKAFIWPRRRIVYPAQSIHYFGWCANIEVWTVGGTWCSQVLTFACNAHYPRDHTSGFELTSTEPSVILRLAFFLPNYCLSYSYECRHFLKHLSTHLQLFWEGVDFDRIWMKSTVLKRKVNIIKNKSAPRKSEKNSGISWDDQVMKAATIIRNWEKVWKWNRTTHGKLFGPKRNWVP